MKWKDKQHQRNEVLYSVFDESDFDVEVESSKRRRRDIVIKKRDGSKYVFFVSKGWSCLSRKLVRRRSNKLMRRMGLKSR